jgi:hypothetical protein
MTEIAYPLTGGCGCGAVRFEIDAPLPIAYYCHCTRCQRRSGTAASANGAVQPGSFRIVAGEDALGSWAPEGGGEKVFCSRCGSAVFTRDPGTEHVRAVRLGSLDRDPGIRPELRQYVAYAATWEAVPDDGLARYDESRPR